MAVIPFRNPNKKNIYHEPEAYDEEDPQDDYPGGFQERYEDQLLQIEEEERNSKDSLDYDDTAERRRRKARLRLLAVLGVLAAVGIAVYFWVGNRSYSAASFSKVSNIDTLSSATYLNLDGSVLSYSRDGAGCMDGNGNKIWNITYEMQQPIVSINGDVVAIGDYNGSTIYLADKEKQLGTINTNMPIRNLCASQSGEVAAVLDDTDVTWIYLYDAQGQTVAYFKTTMQQSGYPVSVSVSPGGEIVGVSFLQANNSAISTSIAFYNFGAVGQNALENNVSGFNFDDEVFPYLYYMNEDTAVAVSDKRAAFFKGSEIPQNESTLLFQDSLEAVYCGKTYAAFLFPDTTGEYSYDLQIYDQEGQKQGDVRFSMDYTEIILTKERVIIHNDTDILVTGIDGTVKYEGMFENKVRIVVPTDSMARLTLVTESSIERMIMQ